MRRYFPIKIGAQINKKVKNATIYLFAKIIHYK